MTTPSSSKSLCIHAFSAESLAHDGDRISQLWFKDLPGTSRPDRFGNTERTTDRIESAGLDGFAQAWASSRHPLVLRRSKAPKYVAHLESVRRRVNPSSAYALTSVFFPDGASDAALEEILKAVVRTVRPCFALASTARDITRKHRMRFPHMGFEAEGIRGLSIFGQEDGYRWTLPGAYPRMYFNSIIFEHVDHTAITAAPAHSCDVTAEGVFVSLSASVYDAETASTERAEEAFRRAVGLNHWFDRRKLPQLEG